MKQLILFLDYMYCLELDIVIFRLCVVEICCCSYLKENLKMWKVLFSLWFLFMFLCFRVFFCGKVRC